MEHSLETRNAMADLVASLVAGGVLEILDASGVALVELALSDPAARAAADGTATFNAISENVSDGSGVATTARIRDASGIIRLYGLTVSTTADGTGDIQLDTTDIEGGMTVSISGASYTASP